MFLKRALIKADFQITVWIAIFYMIVRIILEEEEEEVRHDWITPYRLHSAFFYLSTRCVQTSKSWSHPKNSHKLKPRFPWVFRKPIFCLKSRSERQTCSRLLDPQKVASNAKAFSKVAKHIRDTGIETGPPTIVEIELSLELCNDYRNDCERAFGT